MDIVQMSVQAGVLIAAITIVRAVTLYRLPKMDLDNEQLIHYILVHEYFHIRRLDMLWKLLAVVLALALTLGMATDLQQGP